MLEPRVAPGRVLVPLERILMLIVCLPESRAALVE